MNPTPAEIPKLVAVMCNAYIAPTREKGTFRSTYTASLTLPNIMNRNTKINNKLKGTTDISVFPALT